MVAFPPASSACFQLGPHGLRQQRVVDLQVRRADRDHRNDRPLGSDRMTNPVRIESLAAIRQLAQGLLYQLLAANRREVKDSHILRISPLAVEAAQRIGGRRKTRLGNNSSRQR